MIKKSEKVNKSKKEKEIDFSNKTIAELFNNIDTLIEKMDDNNCSLEENLELYKKGVLLLNEVEKKVDKVEKEVEILEGDTNE